MKSEGTSIESYLQHAVTQIKQNIYKVKYYHTQTERSKTRQKEINMKEANRKGKKKKEKKEKRKKIEAIDIQPTHRKCPMTKQPSLRSPQGGVL